MQNPIPETYPFPGGGLEGLYLSVEKGVRTVTCIEVKAGEEKRHFYGLHLSKQVFSYPGPSAVAS